MRFNKNTTVVLGDGQRLTLGQLFSYSYLGEGADYNYDRLEALAQCECPDAYSAYNAGIRDEWYLMNCLGAQGVREVLYDSEARFIN